MDNYYLKYETDIIHQYELNDLLDALTKWKDNLINEKSVITDIIEILQNNNICAANIINIFESINEIIEIHCGFIKEFCYCLNEYDVDLSDKVQKAKIIFLRENYNNILLIIEQLFSRDKKLRMLREKKNNFTKKEKIFIKSEIEEKFRKDIEKIKNEQISKKENFNFINNKIYPNDELMDKMFDDFLYQAQTENQKLALRAKYCANPKIKEKILSKKVNINMDTSYRYNLPNLK